MRVGYAKGDGLIKKVHALILSFSPGAVSNCLEFPIRRTRGEGVHLTANRRNENDLINGV